MGVGTPFSFLKRGVPPRAERYAGRVAARLAAAECVTMCSTVIGRHLIQDRFQ